VVQAHTAIAPARKRPPGSRKPEVPSRKEYIEGRPDGSAEASALLRQNADGEKSPMYSHVR